MKSLVFSFHYAHVLMTILFLRPIYRKNTYFWYRCGCIEWNKIAAKNDFLKDCLQNTFGYVQNKCFSKGFNDIVHIEKRILFETSLTTQDTPLWIRLRWNIPFRGNSECILFACSNLLIKFWGSDPTFYRDILTLLYLKFQTLEHAQIAIARYYFQISWHNRKLKVTLGNSLINDVGPCIYQLGSMTFSKDTFRSVNCTLPFY